MVQKVGTQCQLCRTPVTAATTIEGKVYWHCPECDLIFLGEDFRPAPEEERARYLLHDNTLENQGYVRMFQRFIQKAVTPFVREGQVALDFGCGPEPVLKALLEREGVKTDVYDPYFAPEIPWTGKQYDLITCTEVLEHVYHSLQVWQLFSRLLRPKGYLAVMTLFHPSLAEFARWWYRQDYTHVCFYSRRTFAWIEGNLPFQMVLMDNKNTVVMQRTDA